MDLLGDIAGRQVLDAGCGEGYLARALAARGARHRHRPVTAPDRTGPRQGPRRHVTDYFDSGAVSRYRGLWESGIRAYYHHRTLENYLDAFHSAGLRLAKLADVPAPGTARSLPMNEATAPAPSPQSSSRAIFIDKSCLKPPSETSKADTGATAG